MTEAARKARNAYQREWARKNKDKIKRYAEKHWDRVAAAAVDQAVAEEEQAREQEEDPAPLIVEL